MQPEHRALLEATAQALDLTESAKTAMLSTTHAPIGKGGSNWITRSKPGNKGQLPAYIQQVRNAIMRQPGMTESRAHAIAIGKIEDWAAGKGKVGPEVRAAARKAIAELKAMGAKAKAKLKETPLADVTIDDARLGDLALLEAQALSEAATKPTPMSNLKRRPGESMHSWGKRLKSDDSRLAAAQTRSGSNASFEKQHPRTRSGEWTLKMGAKGQQVRNAQSHLGVKADGQYGAKTMAAVRRYQQKHGLKVDGIIGAQTLAQMNGHNGKKVKPGKATGTIRRAKKGSLMETPLAGVKLDDSRIGDLSLLAVAS